MYGLMNKSIRLQCISILKRLVCRSVKRESIKAHHNELSHASSVKKSSSNDSTKLRLKNQTDDFYKEKNPANTTLETVPDFSKNFPNDHFVNEENINEEIKNIRSKSFPINSRTSKKSSGNRSLKHPKDQTENKIYKFDFNAWIKAQDDGGIYKGPDYY